MPSVPQSLSVLHDAISVIGTTSAESTSFLEKRLCEIEVKLDHLIEQLCGPDSAVSGSVAGGLATTTAITSAFQRGTPEPQEPAPSAPPGVHVASTTFPPGDARSAHESFSSGARMDSQLTEPLQVVHEDAPHSELPCVLQSELHDAPLHDVSPARELQSEPCDALPHAPCADAAFTEYYDIASLCGCDAAPVELREPHLLVNCCDALCLVQSMYDGFEGPGEAQFLSIIEECGELIGRHGVSWELLMGFVALVQRGGPSPAGAPLDLRAELALVSAWVAFRLRFLEQASAAGPDWFAAAELQAALHVNVHIQVRLTLFNL